MKKLLLALMVLCSSLSGTTLKLFKCSNRDEVDLDKLEQVFRDCFGDENPDSWKIDYGFRAIIYLVMPSGIANIMIDREQNRLTANVLTESFELDKFLEKSFPIINYQFYTFDDENDNF